MLKKPLYGFCEIHQMVLMDMIEDFRTKINERQGSKGPE